MLFASFIMLALLAPLTVDKTFFKSSPSTLAGTEMWYPLEVYLHGVLWKDESLDLILILEAYMLLLSRLAALMCTSGRMLINWKRLCMSLEIKSTSKAMEEKKKQASSL